MALITCPECNREISDKAGTCPNCGYPLTTEDSSRLTAVTEATNTNSVEANNKGKRKTKHIIVAFILIFSLVIGWFGYSSYQTKRAAEAAEEARTTYYKNIGFSRLLMLTGAVHAEEACNLILSVWHNSIYKVKDSETDKYTRKNNGTGAFYDDFNDALKALFSDEDFIEKCNMIKSNQEKITEQMKTMVNPPDEYREAYNSLRNMYTAMVKLSELATNPTGSYNSFSQSFADTDDELLKYYNELSLYTNYQDKERAGQLFCSFFIVCRKPLAGRVVQKRFSDEKKQKSGGEKSLPLKGKL